MFNKIKSDYKRSSNNKRALLVSVIYRTGNAIYYSNINKVIKKILLIIMRLLQIVVIEIPFNVIIPFSTKIGVGLRLPHATGIIIHPNAVIGNNCTIFHQVTIGANEHKLNFREVATIGDEVYIGAGAKIIGKIIIEDKVKIGANAVVIKNIPYNHTVTGFNNIIISKSERIGII